MTDTNKAAICKNVKEANVYSLFLCSKVRVKISDRKSNDAQNGGVGSDVWKGTCKKEQEEPRKLFNTKKYRIYDKFI